MNKYFNWDSHQSRKLRDRLGIGFEDVVFAIQQESLIDSLKFRNQKRAPEQVVLVVEIFGSRYLVPFIETSSAFFLQTIIPIPFSGYRAALSLENQKSQDQVILTAYEAGELLSEISEARKQALEKAAETSLKKDKRINIRLSSRDLDGLQRIAIQQGMPYQTLVASILHKYLAGQLVDIDTKAQSPQPPAWKVRPSRDSH